VESLRDLVVRNRSYRRFDESHRVERETLLELVDLARQTASAANRQPLKYVLSADPQTNARIFPCLGWAAYLKEWPGPAPGERPSAYIVVLVDEAVSKEWWCDDGIAAQTILLGATARGLGGCMIGALRHERLRGVLRVPDHLRVRLVIALGKPAERVVIEPVPPSGDIRYWRDGAGVHHVPKRSLEEVVLAT
jgi:nitroreductase